MDENQRGSHSSIRSALAILLKQTNLKHYIREVIPNTIRTNLLNIALFYSFIIHDIRLT